MKLLILPQKEQRAIRSQKARLSSRVSTFHGEKDKVLTEGACLGDDGLSGIQSGDDPSLSICVIHSDTDPMVAAADLWDMGLIEDHPIGFI